MLYWESIKKQIRITGKAYKIDDSLSDKYYYSRPREVELVLGSQINPQKYQTTLF